MAYDEIDGYEGACLRHTVSLTEREARHAGLSLIGSLEALGMPFPTVDRGEDETESEWLDRLLAFDEDLTPTVALVRDPPRKVGETVARWRDRVRAHRCNPPDDPAYFARRTRG